MGDTAKSLILLLDDEFLVSITGHVPEHYMARAALPYQDSIGVVVTIMTVEGKYLEGIHCDKVRILKDRIVLINPNRDASKFLKKEVA